MNKIFIALLSIAFFLGAFTESKATHFAGSDIQYKCIGTDSFEITFDLFRDCSGNPVGNTANLDFVSSCGGAILGVIVPLVSVTEVSQLCDAELPNSTCNGGVWPGMQHYVYRTVMVLTPPCNSWTISWRDCCRNTSMNVNGQPWKYNKATLNSATAACNNSPEFNAQPIPYVCINQTVNYNFSVTELDGDSIVYRLVPGLTDDGPNDTIPYAAPYSSGMPLIGIVLDNQTGQLTFTPTIPGKWIIVVEVEEYDPITGLLKGTIRRDIQVIVQPCTNTIPTSTGITNLAPGPVSLDSNSIQACYGEHIQFEVDFMDIDTIDTLTVVSNVAAVLPGATFNVVSTTPYQKTAQISWIVQPGMPNFNVFTIGVDDGACPVPGELSISFDITVFNAVYAGEDTTICGGATQSAQLAGVGAPTLTWSVISGPPMVVGTGPGANFSCNPCDNPIATPSATTVYQLSGAGYTGPCDSVDTVTVVIAPNFELVMPNDTVICNIDSLVLVSNATPFNTNITWSWDNASSLNDSTLLSPQAQPNITTTYTLTATSTAGCMKEGDITVTVAPPFPPNIQAIAVDSILCLGQTGQLIADLGSITPISCGANANGCLGTTSQIIVGNGVTTNTVTTYPSILGNFFWGAKHQYLYSAADLNAAGFTGGAIDGLAFFVVGTPNQSTFQQFEIKIGCANLANLSTFQTGLTTVHPAQTITATPGWNQFNFSQVYDYDGTSDLIVEFCFNNGNFTNNGNAQIRYTNTPYDSEIHYYADNANVCPAPGNPFPATKSRVNLRFSVCSGTDPLAYTYQWNPGALLNNTTAQTPTWSPTAAGNYAYQVIIQDTFGVCSDTSDTLPLQVVTSFDATISTQSPYCVSSAIDTLVAATGGGTWSGSGITNTTNGYFDPATAGPGTHLISYAIGGGCASSDTALVVVAPPPNTNITTPGPFCVLDNSIQMLGVVSGGTWGGSPAINPITGILNPSLAGTGTINITYTVSAVCEATGTFPINIISALDATIGNNPDFCINSGTANLQLAAGADPGGTWTGPGITDANLGTFDPNAAGVGTHTITYTHSGSCGGSNSVVINVFALPNSTITGVLPEYCNNFTALVSPNGGTSGGVWSGSFAVNPTTGAFVPSSLNPNNSPYTLTYTVTDINQCSSADNLTFEVFATPPPPAPVSTSQPYCQGESIDDLLATVTGNNTVEWYSDANLSNLLTAGTSYDAGTASTDFTLYLTQTAPAAEGGCVSDVLPLNIQVINNPSPSFTANPSFGVAPLLVNFTNTTQPLGNFTYGWDFKDGNFSSIANPNNTFTEFGTYPVTVTATDAFGCKGTASVDVVVEVNINTFIPNIFTPNGDGKNDVFKVDFIEGLDAVQNFEGSIFNRWGRKVAELSDPSSEWDGGNQGDGVYFYVINITAIDGQEYKLNGHITLLKND